MFAICTPAIEPIGVQILLAPKSAPSGRGARSSAWPSIASAAPYIGDESITPPPRAKNARSTSTRRSVPGAPGARSNVIHVPMPMRGTDAPLDGIVRYALAGGAPGGGLGGLGSAPSARGAPVAPARAAPTSPRRNSRRERVGWFMGGAAGVGRGRPLYTLGRVPDGRRRGRRTT